MIDDLSRCPLNIWATHIYIVCNSLNNVRKKSQDSNTAQNIDGAEHTNKFCEPYTAIRESKQETGNETYEDPWLWMSMVTKTRCTPDLMLERDAFLWTTMKGTSDSKVVVEADINARNTRADTEESFLIPISIFFFRLTDGHSLSHGSFLSFIYTKWTKTYE